MPLKSLEHLAERITFEALPANWNSFDLERFAPGKRLWDYQQDALRKALAVLALYYDDYADFVPGEGAEADTKRRMRLVEAYEEKMYLTKKERGDLNLRLRKKVKRPVLELINEFFPLDEDEPVLDFQTLCNRVGFWMATGSGKTIVLVKLLELLHLLMRRGEIPVNDVLFLTCREDLIEQFQRTVWEYNHAPDCPVHIELRELREYPEAKRETPGGLLGRDSTLRVYFYRSDNLSDEHKERIVDFRNYDNDGRWYVLLDEAHKGGAEDSKRKHIYTILSRAGFLFNFSATFTDVQDLATTVFNFNLAEFITRGYGKHIAILKQELAAFRQRGTGDYSDEEKRKVVAKSMLLLAFTAARVRELRKTSGQPGLYHHPMLLTLVNSVNTEDADLEIYFAQILAIGRNEVPAKLWKEAKAELLEELRDEPAFLYEDKRKVQIAREQLDALTVKDVWRDVYNCESEGGEIEVLARPGNRQEIAFKMKTSARPFALIKIGDVTGWLKAKLHGFEYVETLETESFFKDLDAPESSINILMGSRSFYEGWDSNRPNVINFVNIGVGDDAKKFIMQSVGRGVRVQSWGGERRRFEELSETFEDKALFRRLRPETVFPETLYVLGTNRDALNVVLQELKSEKVDAQQLLQIAVNPEVSKRQLLVPHYRDTGVALMDDRVPSKFEIKDSDFALLEDYGARVPDDRVLLLTHGGTPKKLQYFRKSMAESETYFLKHSSREYRNMEVMVGRVIDYFGLRQKELERLREIGESDIVHFRHMAVDTEHAAEIQRRVDGVLYAKSDEGRKAAATIWKNVEQLDLDFSAKAQELSRLMEEGGLAERQHYHDDLAIEYLANHYYLPVIYSLGKKLEYIRHIIDVDSEVRFLQLLIDSVKKADCELRKLEWWMFSKLDQYLDTPFIPYYSPKENRIARFIPDFIFWGRSQSRYTVLFVDPKGMELVDAERKIDGFKRLFEDSDGKPKIFRQGEMEVVVKLFLFTKDRNKSPEAYRRYWLDSVKQVAKQGFFE